MSRIEQAFHKIADQSGAGALQRLRAEAYEQMTQLTVPSKKEESWKYTSPKGFLESAWGADDSLSVVKGLETLPFYNFGSQATVVMVDGHLREDLSKNLNGIAVTKFSAIAPEAQLKKFQSSEFFERMNLALLNEGIHLEIRTELNAPVTLIFLSTKLSTEFAANYRVLVTAWPNSKATVVEYHHSLSAGSASQIVTQVDVQANANIAYIKVHGASEAQHLSTTQFNLARDSRIESTQMTLGGLLVRQNLQVNFAEQGAEATVNGLYLASGAEHIDNHTLIDHAVGNTTSSQLYKGILDGQSKGVFTGGVRIRKDAQKANSSQLNNNLMLSQKAEIDTKPELEIEADDVKAAHGATIGQINPEHVFYLQSRALSKKQAVEILALGFAQDIVDRISDSAVKVELAKLVKHKFSSFRVDEI